jgi:hypothetical protein
VHSLPTTWALPHFGCWYATLRARLHTNNGLRDGNTTDAYQQRQSFLFFGTLRRTGERSKSFYLLELYEEQGDWLRSLLTTTIVPRLFTNLASREKVRVRDYQDFLWLLQAEEEEGRINERR